jgi:hypothetical protein
VKLGEELLTETAVDLKTTRAQTEAAVSNKKNSEAPRDASTPPNELRYLLKTCRSLRQKLAGARRAVDLSRARIDAYLREPPAYLKQQPVMAKSTRARRLSR